MPSPSKVQPACCDFESSSSVLSISELDLIRSSTVAWALGFMRMAVTSLQLIGVENILNVPFVAASCSAAEKHAVPSVSVMVLKPCAGFALG